MMGGEYESTGRTPANGWAYQTSPDEEQDSGTDTDTSSDTGHEPIDMSEFNCMSQEEAVEQAFLNYRFHKRRWRRMMGKPVSGDLLNCLAMDDRKDMAEVLVCLVDHVLMPGDI